MATPEQRARRSRQREISKAIRSGTYQRSSIGKASARASRGIHERNYVNNMDSQLGNRPKYNPDYVRRQASAKRSDGKHVIPTDKLRSYSEMDDSELLDQGKQSALDRIAGRDYDGKEYGYNPAWYHEGT